MYNSVASDKFIFQYTKSKCLPPITGGRLKTFDKNDFYFINEFPLIGKLHMASFFFIWKCFEKLIEAKVI